MENNVLVSSVDTVLLLYFYHVSTILFSFQYSTMYANDSGPGNYSVGSSISIAINV